MTISDVLGSEAEEFGFAVAARLFNGSSITAFSKPFKAKRMCQCGRDVVVREDSPHSLCRKCEWSMGC